MKFKGQPNLYVKFANKYVQRSTGLAGIHFNSDGIYETENKYLIKILSQHFESFGIETTKTEDATVEQPHKVTEDEIKEKAKQLKIKSWHVMSIEKLLIKIKEIEDGEHNVTT